MATPYHKAADPSHSFFPVSITNQFLPPGSESATTSPAYSPSAEQEPWPQAHITSNVGLSVMGSIPIPSPRISHSSTSGSYGLGVAKEEQEAQRRNPLVDLMESESLYAEQLGLIIRRAAGAWSRKDFPPAKLDSMFRSVEAVYRANRGFGQKLREIGPNPSSPKVLGDLLMRWIDDLEPAYRRYAANFLSGFDSYPPVVGNTLLPGILDKISSSSRPTPPLTEWTLDALFILPYTRLRYYRKLYTRLLRSTKEGKSDHKLLVVANERLEKLVREVEARLELDVGDHEGENPTCSSAGNVKAEERDEERLSRSSSALDGSIESHGNRIEGHSSSGSVVTSITQSPQRLPAIQSSVGASSAPLFAITSPLSDLELRIDPEKTIDLFTMKLKKCKLQMNPPLLPFSRTLRSSHDVTLYFTPSATGQQIVHKRAHIFILSDLFIIAEWMEAADKASKMQQIAREQPERVGRGGPMPEMWLSYPPLAGKHLMVAEEHQANILTVMIMRKETFAIHAESEIGKDQIMRDLIECIDFASSVNRSHSAAPSPNDGQPLTSAGLTVTHFPTPIIKTPSPSTSPRPGSAKEAQTNVRGLVAQVKKVSLGTGECVAWARAPTQPTSRQMPMPVAAVAPSIMTAPPPRGTSLCTREVPPNSKANQTLPSLQPSQFALFQHRQIMPSSSTQKPVLPLDQGMAFLEQDQLSTSQPPSRSPSGQSVDPGPLDLRMQQDLPPATSLWGPGPFISDQGHGSNSLTLRINPLGSRSLEQLRPLKPPSSMFTNNIPRQVSPLGASNNDDSPPLSPVEEEIASLTEPTIISAQMKCKVFLKQTHQQWKPLGSGKLKLYSQVVGHVKQLVVESDSSSKRLLISTIILTDGVERVAKTGVAVEISDRGKRTGIVYMIQLRNENSALGLFESLLAGSDRAVQP
uniref:GEF1p n=2 Tax=Cryptococcus gattii TaxID=552467 RepID=Q5Y261_CRYGA|nr:GEF1p [Cryptococcus gattii]